MSSPYQTLTLPVDSISRTRRATSPWTKARMQAELVAIPSAPRVGLPLVRKLPDWRAYQMIAGRDSGVRRLALPARDAAFTLIPDHARRRPRACAAHPVLNITNLVTPPPVAERKRGTPLQPSAGRFSALRRPFPSLKGVRAEHRAHRRDRGETGQSVSRRTVQARAIAARRHHGCASKRNFSASRATLNGELAGGRRGRYRSRSVRAISGADQRQLDLFCRIPAPGDDLSRPAEAPQKRAATDDSRVRLARCKLAILARRRRARWIALSAVATQGRLVPQAEEPELR